MTEPVELLVMFVDESDTWNGAPLYHAVVERLRHLRVAGATARIGILGFGHHTRVHRRDCSGSQGDRPITITVVDEESKLRAHRGSTPRT